MRFTWLSRRAEGTASRRCLYGRVPCNLHGPVWTQGLCHCSWSRPIPDSACAFQSLATWRNACVVPGAQGYYSVLQHISWGGGCWGTHTPMTSVTCTSPGLSLAGWDICSTCGCGGHPEGPPHAPLPGPSCLHPDIVRTTPRSEPVCGLPRGTFPARPVIFKPWVHSPSEHVDVNKTEGSKLK